MVPKKNGKWRICIDYSDLNEACPKDSFPLPRIDHIVDTTTRHELLSFMDAYSGYNQIPMFLPYVVKTAFITMEGMLCYKVMSFRLKNTRVIYQRMMTKIFEPLLGKTMEAYINNMLVKLPKNDRKGFHSAKSTIVQRK